MSNPYEGYKLYRLTPTTEEQTTTLMNLAEEKNPGVIFLTRLDEITVKEPTDIMVLPELQSKFVEELTKRGLATLILGEVK